MNKKAFTLVELIVVITILAVLATVAFISFQGYGVSARDSARLTDLNSMTKVLELYNVQNSRYPSPTDPTNITYSGSTAWTQGVFGKTAYTNNTSMSHAPVDPVTGLEYPYSRTANGQEYQIAVILENPVTTNIFPETYAETQTAEIYVKGNYNGQFLKVSTSTATYILGVPTILTSDITSSTLLENIIASKSLVYDGYTNLPASFSGSIYEVNPTDGFDFVPNQLILFEGDIDDLENDESARILFLENLQTNYTGTEIETETEISELLSIDSTSTTDASNYVATTLNNSLFMDIPVATTILEEGIINQTDCEDIAGWKWVTEDVYIGSTQGSGFCISPRFGDWNNDSENGNGGISWNGWGNYPYNHVRGWNASSVDDTLNSNPEYGQVRVLDSQVSYDCKSLGTATSDYEINDTLIGRMKWLASTGNTYTNAQNISWIVQNGTNNPLTTVNGHAIPALYIADCIDGNKDLGGDMNYKHYPDESLNDTITYNEYTTNATNDPDLAYLSNVVYQNRQKYLIAWTQMTGAHLPSAMSYITNGYASASKDNGNSLIGADRGEYQVACELGLNINSEGTDDSENEWIWLSAIGSTNGSLWGRNPRILGSSGCSSQGLWASGNRKGVHSSRFIVRP